MTAFLALNKTAIHIDCRRIFSVSKACGGSLSWRETMELAAFLSFVATMSFTPGPNNLMALSQSRRLGFFGALPFLAGLFISFFIIDALVVLCLQSLQGILPRIEVPLKVAGTVYILFLTYKTAMPPGEKTAVQPGSGTLFMSGILLNLTNVKVILYMIMGYISFILPAYASIFMIAILGAVMCLAASLSNILWALAGAGLSRLFNRYEKWCSAVLAMMLLFSAAEIWL